MSEALRDPILIVEDDAGTALLVKNHLAEAGWDAVIVTTGQAPEEISDLAAFAGVHAFPARIKCATLGWHATLEALKQPPSA